MLLLYTLLSTLLFLFSLLSTPTGTLGAFTTPVTSGNDSSVIEQNSAGTWCYYPAPRSNRTIALDRGCTGSNADFQAVMATHLAQGASISYYGAALERLGGPEYPVRSTNGKVYLCISGRATDGLYETSCEQATRDNEFGRGPFGNRSVCALAMSQENVSDGCYAPGLSGGSTSSNSSNSSNSAPETFSRAGFSLILFAIVAILYPAVSM